MNIYDELENLKAEARSNPELAQALLATRETIIVNGFLQAT